MYSSTIIQECVARVLSVYYTTQTHLRISCRHEPRGISDEFKENFMDLGLTCPAGRRCWGKG